MDQNKYNLKIGSGRIYPTFLYNVVKQEEACPNHILIFNLLEGSFLEANIFLL